MEANAEDFEFQFDNFSPYDIADVVKGYFRDLPEPLMTGKLSQTFTSIFLGLNFHISNYSHFSFLRHSTSILAQSCSTRYYASAR